MSQLSRSLKCSTLKELISIMKMTYFKFHNTIHIFILIARTNQFRITIDSHRLDFALLRKNGKGCIFKFTYRYKKEKCFKERKCKEYPFYLGLVNFFESESFEKDLKKRLSNF